MLQLAGGGDALPGARDLDQHPLARDARFLVAREQPARFRDRAFGIERQARISFGRDPARDVAQDFAAEVDRQLLHGRGGVAAAARKRVLDKRAIARVLGGGKQERWVGGGVARLPACDGVDVAAVGDDDRVLAQGFELVHGAGRRALACDISGIGRGAV
jgi:hypothetical protein